MMKWRNGFISARSRLAICAGVGGGTGGVAAIFLSIWHESRNSRAKRTALDLIKEFLQLSEAETIPLPLPPPPSVLFRISRV